MTTILSLVYFPPKRQHLVSPNSLSLIQKKENKNWQYKGRGENCVLPSLAFSAAFCVIQTTFKFPFPFVLWWLMNNSLFFRFKHAIYVYPELCLKGMSPWRYSESITAPRVSHCTGTLVSLSIQLESTWKYTFHFIKSWIAIFKSGK